jgi:hypothetical protein
MMVSLECRLVDDVPAGENAARLRGAVGRQAAVGGVDVRMTCVVDHVGIA